MFAITALKMLYWLGRISSMDNFILCGMQFGDEGKGTFVDYLIYNQNIDCIVKYNGGSQASHTVITPSRIVHKFSQLGSGMFSEKCHTYLTDNMVINIENLLVELDVFSSKTKIPIPELINRIHIHENCFIVTPYHKLINKLRELSKGDNRRGTVGTGVSEVQYLLNEQKKFPCEQPLGLMIKDIYNHYNNNSIIERLQALQEYVLSFYLQNQEIISKNIPDELKENLSKEISFLLHPKAFFTIASHYITEFKYARKEFNLQKCLYSNYDSAIRTYHNAIYEGSQGLLIDNVYGIKPNTTFLDTTNSFALSLSHANDVTHKIGITKAFMSRHGLGIFPTESSTVSNQISDENQNFSFWNGKIRFGWFDSILVRYAQSINKVNELYLSALDKLDDFDTIKVCNEYIYSGTIDSEFKKIFSYYLSENGQVIITDIKENHKDLNKYLSNCIPKYICVNGWKSNITQISNKSYLPTKCLEYIKLLEKLVCIPITIVSVGPTRENKIKLTV